MTSKEHKQLAMKIKETARQVEKNPGKSKEFLFKAGICDKKGKLKRAYR